MDNKKSTTINKSIWRFLTPNLWPSWIAVGLAWCIAQLPLFWLRALGKLLGALLYRVASRRRHICETNLRLCFPEKSDLDRTEIAQKHFQSMGMGMLEMLVSWFHKVETIAPYVTFNGQEILDETFKDKKGCIIIGGHFSSIDICGGQMTRFVNVHPIYKLQSNPVINWVMERQRQRTFEKTIEKSNMREVAKSLKANRMVWYAVDQDYGRKASVFAPFFGNECATIAQIGRIARITNAPVLLYDYYRTKDGYHISLQATPDGFPYDDDVDNAIAMNQMMEGLITPKIEQYFWSHRRFKTQKDPHNKDPYS